MENQIITMTTETLANAYYESYLKLAAAENTQEGYKYALATYKRYNNDNDFISYAGTRKMVDGLLADGRSPETINQYLGKLSKIVGWASKIGVIQFNFLDADIFPRLKTIKKLHENVTDDMDFNELLNVVTNIRDRAILVLLGVAGMRKSEVTNLNLEDIVKLETGEYRMLITNPKNGKQRYSILASDYAIELEEHLKTVVSGAVFTASKTGERLNERSINYIVKKYGKFKPHSFRHRTGEKLFQAGASVDDISQVLGNSISTCEKVYKGIDLERQKNTSNLLRRED